MLIKKKFSIEREWSYEREFSEFGFVLFLIGLVICLIILVSNLQINSYDIFEIDVSVLGLILSAIGLFISLLSIRYKFVVKEL